MTPEELEALARRAAQRSAPVNDIDRLAQRAAARGYQQPAPPEDHFLNPTTGQMTSRELLRNAEPMDPDRAASQGYMQGYAFNGADEMAGAAGRIVSPDMGRFSQERFRALDEAAQEQYPKTYATSQFIGNVLSPVAKMGAGLNTFRGAAGVAGAAGALDGFNRGEGSAMDRAGGAATGFGVGALFGGAAAGAIRGGSAAYRRLAQRGQERPTLGILKATKNQAYQDVERANVTFSQADMQGLYSKIRDIAEQADFDDVADPQTAATVRLFERRSNESDISLSRLDRLRQNLWSRYRRSDEPMVLDAIGAIDDLVASRAEGNSLIQAARLANSRYAKAELLENAFRRARLQTASTGSGGNILNKYRQAVTRIVTNPNEARWFDPEEIALMERFIDGDDVENTLRRAGKLAPGGNGLMTALNVYAATIDPTLLAVTGAAQAAKSAADRGAMQGSERILDAVSTGRLPPSVSRPPLGRAAIGAGVAGPSYLGGR